MQTMSKLSIYENSWLDLVFEGRNKEYGAYQLRQENGRTTLKALFFGTLIAASLISIPVISSLLKEAPVADVSTYLPPSTIVYVEPILVKPEQKKIEPAATVEKSSQKQTKHVTPKITDALTPPVEVAVIDPKTVVKTGNNDNLGDDKGVISLGKSDLNGTGEKLTHIPTTLPSDDGNGILPNVGLESSPEFPGGLKKFFELVANRFETPEGLNINTVKVHVFFVVEKDGSLSNIKVTRDPGYGLGNEAIRVLKSIKTKWKPGIQKGQPVRTAYNLPISVNIR